MLETRAEGPGRAPDQAEEGLARVAAASSPALSMCCLSSLWKAGAMVGGAGRLIVSRSTCACARPLPGLDTHILMHFLMAEGNASAAACPQAAQRGQQRSEHPRLTRGGGGIGGREPDQAEMTHAAATAHIRHVESGVPVLERYGF
jgi:hypothetical protein